MVKCYEKTEKKNECKDKNDKMMKFCLQHKKRKKIFKKYTHQEQYFTNRQNKH